MSIDYAVRFSHWLFQLANCFLFLSYVSPSILALRIFIASAGLCFLLWGWLVLPFSIDTVVWNGIFVCINIVQTLRILWSMRTVSWDADRAKIFEAFFSGANGGSNKLPQAEFKALTDDTAVMQVPVAQNAQGGTISRGASFSRKESTSILPLPPPSASANGGGGGGGGGSASPPSASARVPATVPTQLCQVKTYRRGDLVAALGERANTLSIILEGRCVVEALREPAEIAAATAAGSFSGQAWRPVAVLHEMSFTDSPEWTSRRSQRRPVYSVQIRVDSPVARVFTWDAHALDSFLRTRSEHTGAVLMSVVGLDLARKVFAANIDQKQLEEELYHAPMMSTRAAMQQQDALLPPPHHHLAAATPASRATASQARLFHLLTPEVGVNAAAEAAAALTASMRTGTEGHVRGSTDGINGFSRSLQQQVATPASTKASPHPVLSIELADVTPAQMLSPVPSASPVSPVVGDALSPGASTADQNRALASLLYYTRATPKLTATPAMTTTQRGDDDAAELDAVSFHLDEDQA